MLGIQRGNWFKFFNEGYSWVISSMTQEAVTTPMMVIMTTRPIVNPLKSMVTGS
jgi:hypothetical protein